MEHNHSLLNLLFDIRLGGFLFIIALFLGYKKRTGRNVFEDSGLASKEGNFLAWVGLAIVIAFCIWGFIMVAFFTD
ncbi:MAG: hypothetical protein J6W29_08110 [Neisseriaceae bacterium]|nr:hypothetical protein [Neisseriaceae bacterium]